ncbi:MAG: hypothetical protein HYZ23_04630 [Chloroflexi bacterium]|nr:hypothetical protein [Chloroflexota bacterium]
MDEKLNFPSFDARFHSLNEFILNLVFEYRAWRLQSWDDLDWRVKIFFTPEQMDKMEFALPGWKKMASYANGVTLTHVMCVFLGLFMLPEFEAASFEEQQLAKWIVLFHDIEKEAISGTRDQTHGFRSAIRAAQTLPNLGFAKTRAYGRTIDSWSKLAGEANVKTENFADPIQDNCKLPELIGGIDTMFEKDSPASLVVKGVLLHMSINVVDDWPQAAPLTDEEIKTHVDAKLCPLLKMMCLADNEGWSMFYPETRERQRSDTLKAFEMVGKMVMA